MGANNNLLSLKRNQAPAWSRRLMTRPTSDEQGQREESAMELPTFEGLHPRTRIDRTMAFASEQLAALADSGDTDDWIALAQDAVAQIEMATEDLRIAEIR